LDRQGSAVVELEGWLNEGKKAKKWDPMGFRPSLQVFTPT